MGRLTVFSVEGEQLHPAGNDQFESRYATYVGNVRFRVDFDAAAPFFEAYVRVRTENRKEQVYLRYDGDQPATLFADCRKAVRQELVKGRGWTFSKRSHTEPSKLFTDLVLQEPQPAVPSIEGTILADEATLVDEILDSGEHQLTIYARNYTYLGGLVAKYTHPGRSIVVAENPQTQTDATLLLLHSSEFGTVGIPDETVEIVREIKERRHRIQRRKQYEQIQTALGELAAQDVDAETVVKELQPRLSKHFDQLRLETGPHQAHPDQYDPPIDTPQPPDSKGGFISNLAGVLATLFTIASRPRIFTALTVTENLPEIRLPLKQIGYVVAVGVLLGIILLLITELGGAGSVKIPDLLPF